MESLIVLAFLMTALAIPTITFLPVFAKDVFSKGPETLSLFLACIGPRVHLRSADRSRR